ncbi:hypothetical protein [Massilia rubra]|uniref:Uncharacterized protein n=1 Tax=Massilia rubra TaxID=2607910 RepID=A0ABX0M3E6_9BURK|nr:hypothetical protein [Massilia rubra]NHZ36756.1 hypothetical protein [Massilia rubra]
MIKAIPNDYFSLLGISYLEENKILTVEFGGKTGDIHIRKYGLVDLCLPDVWIVSDMDILNIFGGRYMPYLCVFFRNLEQFCFVNRIQLPLKKIDLRDIGRYDLDGRAYDELIGVVVAAR